MKFIQVSEQNNIATVSLHRPEVRNAFNPEMIAEISKIFAQLGEQTSLRAVVLRGEGKSFCAGADLAWMKEMIQYSREENKKDSLLLFSMFEAINNCPVPVVGVVHGAAFGGALGLLACCDYVVCEEKTQLCFSEVKLGIAPAVISAFVLRKAALGFVAPLMLSGKVFTAADAKAAGLVHDICDEENMPDKLDAILTCFKMAGPQAVRASKKLLLEMKALSWPEKKAKVTDLIADLRVSEEGQEGLRSFLEKRQTSWSPS